MTDELARPVGDIPSGLFIVCAQNPKDNRPDGFLASWVQQVSFDPLLISVCIKPGRPCADSILEGEAFSINVVGEHDKGYLKHFWSGYSPDKNPFAEIPHQITEEGGIVLAEAKSALVCRKVQVHQPGDHHLVVAEVLSGLVQEEEAKPAIHLRKSGLKY